MSSSEQELNLSVEYAPDRARELEALAVALGLPEEDIKAMLAARRGEETEDSEALS